MHRDDVALARRILAGDESSFNEFFSDYYPRLYRFLLRRLPEDEETARDVAQASLAKAMRKIHLYRGEAALFTWLCQIARNDLADTLERERGRTGSRPALVAREDDPEVRASLESLTIEEHLLPERQRQRDELSALVHAALDYLPARHAAVLELKYLEDLSVEQIATRLGTSAVAVQSLLARARSAFREACDALGCDLTLLRGEN